MTTEAMAIRRGVWVQLAGAGLVLVVVAAALGIAVNFLRPGATRLP